MLSSATPRERSAPRSKGEISGSSADSSTTYSCVLDRSPSIDGYSTGHGSRNPFLMASEEVANGVVWTTRKSTSGSLHSPHLTPLVGCYQRGLSKPPSTVSRRSQSGGSRESTPWSSLFGPDQRPDSSPRRRSQPLRERPFDPTAELRPGPLG